MLFCFLGMIVWRPGFYVKYLASKRDTYPYKYVETSIPGHGDPSPQAPVKASVDCNPKVTARLKFKMQWKNYPV